MAKVLDIANSYKLPEINQALGIVGVGLDMVEIISVWIEPTAAQFPAAVDFVVGGFSSFTAGESYLYMISHPCLPPMTVIGQDALVPGVDYGIGKLTSKLPALGTAIGAPIGLATENPAAPIAGYWIGRGIATASDTLMSGFGLYYDAERLAGTMPTLYAFGVFIEDGELHKALIHYQQD